MSAARAGRCVRVWQGCVCLGAGRARARARARGPAHTRVCGCNARHGRLRASTQRHALLCVWGLRACCPAGWCTSPYACACVCALFFLRRVFSRLERVSNTCFCCLFPLQGVQQAGARGAGAGRARRELDCVVPGLPEVGRGGGFKLTRIFFFYIYTPDIHPPPIYVHLLVGGWREATHAARAPGGVQAHTHARATRPRAHTTPPHRHARTHAAPRALDVRNARTMPPRRQRAPPGAWGALVQRLIGPQGAAGPSGQWPEPRGTGVVAGVGSVASTASPPPAHRSIVAAMGPAQLATLCRGLARLRAGCVCARTCRRACVFACVHAPVRALGSCHRCRIDGKPWPAMM